MSTARLLIGTGVAFTLSQGVAFADTYTRMCDIAYSWGDAPGYWNNFWLWVWAFSGC